MSDDAYTPVDPIGPDRLTPIDIVIDAFVDTVGDAYTRCITTSDETKE